MILDGGNYVSGTKPFMLPHPPKPKPLEAVAGTPATDYNGNLTTNSKGQPSAIVGQPTPEHVIIMINGRNLVDIIAELQAG
jgi:hypothetical protein